MANEITMQASLSVQRSPALVHGSESRTFNQSATGRSVQSQQSVGTGSNTEFKIDGTTNLAFIFFKNLDSAARDTTKYVHLAYDNGLTQVIAKLQSGDVCGLPERE